MIWFKVCPRCTTGDLYLDEDNCGHCLQCGYIRRGPTSSKPAGLLDGDGRSELPVSIAREAAM